MDEGKRKGTNAIRKPEMKIIILLTILVFTLVSSTLAMDDQYMGSGLIKPFPFPAGAVSSSILSEDGDYILSEDGDYILQE
jgi:hypothetical protein